MAADKGNNVALQLIHKLLGPQGVTNLHFLELLLSSSGVLPLKAPFHGIQLLDKAVSAVQLNSLEALQLILTTSQGVDPQSKSKAPGKLQAVEPYAAGDECKSPFIHKTRPSHIGSPKKPEFLENDISGSAITDDQLWDLFEYYDVNKNGYLSKKEFAKIYRSLENFGLPPSGDEISRLLNEFNVLGDDKLSFEEFAIVMLRIAQR
uniref:EF-hand domain-containing protein n=1 Tax=Eutreptiella gymnastica TaxID=73025 RepID=A0A7S4CYT2_9EUGL